MYTSFMCNLFRGRSIVPKSESDPKTDGPTDGRTNGRTHSWSDFPCIEWLAHYLHGSHPHLKHEQDPATEPLGLLQMDAVRSFLMCARAGAAGRWSLWLVARTTHLAVAPAFVGAGRLANFIWAIRGNWIYDMGLIMMKLQKQNDRFENIHSRTVNKCVSNFVS